jgi:hypothetical protein
VLIRLGCSCCCRWWQLALSRNTQIVTAAQLPGRRINPFSFLPLLHMALLLHVTLLLVMMLLPL